MKSRWLSLVLLISMLAYALIPHEGEYRVLFNSAQTSSETLNQDLPLAVDFSFQTSQSKLLEHAFEHVTDQETYLDTGLDPHWMQHPERFATSHYDGDLIGQPALSWEPPLKPLDSESLPLTAPKVRKLVRTFHPESTVLRI